MFARIGALTVALGLFVSVVSSAHASFGLVPGSFKTTATNADGTIDLQAGSHPYAYTVSFAFNHDSKGEPEGNVRDIEVLLPPGFVGSPLALPRCPHQEFEGGFGYCNGNTQVGVIYPTLAALGETIVELFDLVPPYGMPARLAGNVNNFNVFEDASVRTGNDYGVTIDTNNIAVNGVKSVSETVWGVPPAKGHDPERRCLPEKEGGSFIYGCSSTAPSKPFLTLPTSCDAPLRARIRVDSKEEPGVWHEETTTSMDAAGNPAPLTGCERLPFEPFTTIAPDTQQASTPTGLTVHVKVPQESALAPEGLAGADVRDTTVTLPEGVALNPAGADGLEACSETQIGYEPQLSTPEDLRFTPALPKPFEPGVNFCPDGSKIGTVKITTPLLASPLEGAVYLAEPAPNGEPGRNPFNTLIAMYIVAEDKEAGVLVKLPGEVTLDQQTGRIVSTFKNTPPLPFEDLELHFFGGERAPLAMPAYCGTYTTHAVFAPWSGTPPVDSTSSFQITSGPGGTPCPGTLPFAPSLAAGMTSVQAGGFSPFTMTMSREDGNQNLKAIQLRMPPGLSGSLAGVKLCGETEANAGTCGPESLIGETVVSVGLGSDPFSVTGGKVYITGPYQGAPFGLSIVNPAKAGPFDLGHVIVRAKIEVDPHTADLTITSDDTGPYAIPPSIDGIPLNIKHVNVTITRPGFTFNPTDCNPEQITGTLHSIEDASANVAIPFQVTNCASLKFKPAFKVSTAGKTSRKNGASLNVKLSYLPLPQGSQANISKVKVDLPKQLPSRLTTLKLACTAAQFASNPAGCPPGSIVGYAKATTPILPVALQGPAYFVSHGGEEFPNLIIVLQGYGVTVDLVGDTFINEKTSITSSIFNTVPDVPVGTFELNLPQGQDSALAATTNLCKTKLHMPTSFTAQNGAEIHQSTPITVTGCPKHKTKPKGKQTAKHRKNK